MPRVAFRSDHDIHSGSRSQKGKRLCNDLVNQCIKGEGMRLKNILIATMLMVTNVSTANRVLAADGSSPSAAGIQVLGVTLNTATRNEARSTMKAQGAIAKREDDRYWYDLYDPSSLLQGASQLSVGYSIRTNKLAFVQYEFPAFMETEKVKEVGDMVAQKYGHPSSATGNIGLGPVEYDWNLNGGVKLTVSRDWPDTTVYMTYQIPAAFKQMQAEMAENNKEQKQQSAKKQSNAF